MPSEIKIDNVEVIIARESLLVDRRIEERSIAEFTVIDRTGASHYQKGQPVAIKDPDTTLVFGGVIDTPVEERDGSGLLHYITCADWHYLADKRIVAETYEDELAGDIAKDVRTKYLLDEGVTAGTIQDGPTLAQVVANYVRAAEFYDALAEKASFIWEIDENKALQFLLRSTNAAPWAFTNAPGDMIRGSARLSRGNPLYRNRQFIRGGRAETDPQVEEFVGDGERVAFTLGYPLAKVPAITVTDRGAQTYGIKGIDEGKDWYWNKGDATVTAAVAPIATKVVEVTYTGEFNIITLSEDKAAIIDRQTVEGAGTGYVDDVFHDPNATTLAACFERAAKKLQKYGTIGRMFTYQTHRSGLKPGQLQPVTYAPFNLTAVEMLIEAVKITADGDLLTYDITAIEGPAMGSWSKLFQKLAEGEKDVSRLFVGDLGTVIILVQESEVWGWNEVLDVTVYACPIPSVDLDPDGAALFPC